MENQEKSQIKLNCFEIFSLFWISFAILSLITALFGFFNIWSIIIILAILILITTNLIIKKTIQIKRLDRFSIIILAIITAVGIFLSVFTTPTIFGGRDEGSYSQSAILISKNGNLTYDSKLVDDFFQIYGPGKALNFPGFYYTEKGTLKSQFLPGYPTWLATFFTIGKTNGLKFANLFPFITFVFSFFLIIKLILNKSGQKKDLIKKAQLISFLILITTFPLLVFYKFTLSEIYFASIAWFALYLFMKYLENKSIENYLVIFLPLILMPFIRIEAVAIIFFFVLIMILKDANHLQKPRYQIPLIITAISFIIAIYSEPNFFINSLKSIIPFDVNSNGSIDGGLSTGGFGFADDWKNLFTLRIFFVYNLIAMLVMAIIIVVRAISRFSLSTTDRVKKDISKINSYTLIPFVFFFPTFVYLIDANVSLDHPWFLRRFLFSIIPLIILYSGIFLAEISEKSKLLTNLLVIAILVINLSLLFPSLKNINQNFLTNSQNKNLLNQTEEISKNFSPNDLILVSRQSSGSGWSLISEPMRNLMGLNAIYFFNPSDLEKIDLNDFENVYLITSVDELELYNSLNFEGSLIDYRINNNIINPSKDPEDKPSFTEQETTGLIYKIVGSE